VLFFCATMTAQFVGGAKLFSAVTGYSYEMGLLLFGLTVVLYTAIGGFRAVALTDTCCAIVMMVGIVLLLYYVLQAGGGYEQIMATLHADHPEMFEPLSAGHMPLTLYLTQWILVGICTIALPQSVVRGISYKDTKGLHQAMLIGTVVVGFMNIGINFTGILAHGVLTGPLESYGGVDNIIPKTIVKKVNDIIEISTHTDEEMEHVGRLPRNERIELIKQLTKEMQAASKLLEFEHAAYLRDKIKELQK
jgi:sodium/pantothenate symporter